DADIDVGRIVRRGRDDQWPRHQRRGLSRPAGLDRQFVEVDLGIAPDDILARRARYRPVSQGKGGLEMAEFRKGLAHRPRRLRFTQLGEEGSKLRYSAGVKSKPPFDPLAGSEQVGEKGNGG